MTFEIELNGRGRTVSIERAAHGRYRVIVDGVAAVVDARRSGESGVFLLFPDHGHEGVSVELVPGPAPGEMLAYLGGRNIAISVNGPRTGPGAGARAGRATRQREPTPP